MRKQFLAAIALAIPFGIPAAWAQPADGPVADAPAPDALNRHYPLCGGAIQDECVNPRQAGMHYGRIPLGYWLGRPASDMRRSGNGGGWHPKQPRN